ncbi:uncharacterized protein LOC129785968 isoform X1 [Lutzomyia longipalpis]|uniref:uncharacterized protein LOC129785968 isoform X1 n=1 Tax=Lutzomyia longipalpis TaxID=7200 RepID=UPI002483A4A1|nr:uncharacterized protein LOC129785968 isoform X1 [Lutzomyia longipalpis]XP_055676651.1 uncharacterized protein LOC129785968 isoform X1 [Lutzomyia longipalpis]XP_055676652.1 uncharacterized protein LOC129785968 isoform X1 [Lutzomyia longipalpis]
MSNSNHFQPWVRGGFYGKSDNESTAAPGASSSMSLDLYTQIGLQKVAALYKASREAGDSASGWTEADDEKTRKMQQFVEATIGDCAKEQIFQLVEKISQLKPPERLFLYLRMPGGNSETDPLRQPQNPLGTRSEITHTINWVRSHLEHDPAVSIPKQDVYDDYIEYCSRSGIKPLSTADFGKVMKQVFPNVRPRRLGTRGHSRYCYSAMRKATKLSPPVLPELGGDTKVAVGACEATDDEAWGIVKGWAESLLSASFGTLKDLASHINSHGLHLPTNTASRILLQKKLLQRDGKEKKKCSQQDADVGVSVKKRRKRRRKNSASSTESMGCPQFSDTDNNNGSCQENRQICVKSMRNNSTSSCSQDMKPFACEDLPYGKEEPYTGHQEPNLSIQGTNSSCDSGQVCQSMDTVCVKQEADAVEHQTVFCKKVRQAQQAKGLWPLQATSGVDGVNLAPNGPSDEMKVHNFSQPQLPQSALKYEKRMMSRDATFKRIRLPGFAEEVPENGGEIPGDFILPRERVISICNMDKDALDDYLNGGDNSQEPEAELMQYFAGEEGAKGGGGGDYESADLGQLQTSIPLLENYQLFSDGKGDGKGDGTKAGEAGSQIHQLRQYLQQNLQSSSKNPAEGSMGNPLNLYPGSASASLAMMSQRHMSEAGGGAPVNLGKNAVRKKLNIATTATDATSGVPHSPNTRRRNFSFVPISAGPQSPQIRTSSITSCRQTQTFVSPRVTPVTKRSFKVHCTSTMVPVKTEAASAPPSPPWMGKGSGYAMKQPMTPGNVPSAAETRSQSVPLHCRSPIFGSTMNCSAYTSACSSVAQTPIPPDYTDFTSDVSLLDYFSPAPPASAAPGIIAPGLDAELNMGDFPSNSRSVPSTPLPINGTTMPAPGISGNYGKMYDMSKSMPSTPLTGGGLFRYSPEINRDFLINGNSLEASKQPQPFYQQQTPVTTNSVAMDATMGDKEFSTFTDSIISNLNDDPTFESELLDNL